ncbi:MAG: TPP-dependent pyruvate/acetoin dehydrogenase alpha subunit [Granulosicoccus sp.]
MISTNDHRLWMYEQMYKSRQYEAAIKIAYMEGKQPVFNMANGPLPGEMHLSDGQEPCAVGVCAHLKAEDVVTATHRPHHIAIAKGVDLNRMTAEIFGKQSGLSEGRGGHMHLFDSSVNFSCSGIIAQGMGPAVGAAEAARMQGTDNVAVSFIGDGAANQGAFHESLNLASVWNSPVIFVIEDNGWGISVAKKTSTAIRSNSDRASAYGLPGYHITGNEPDAIYEVAGEAITRARQGGGPTLIEIETIRLEGHFMGDAEGYRTENEKQENVANDPIPRYRAKLLGNNIANEAELTAIEESAKSLVTEAFDFARSSRYPDLDVAFSQIFAEA